MVSLKRLTGKGGFDSSKYVRFSGKNVNMGQPSNDFHIRKWPQLQNTNGLNNYISSGQYLNTL